MTDEQFIDWMEGLETPQVFTDDLKEDILDNFQEVITQMLKDYD